MLNNEMDDFAIPNRESAYGMPPSPANLLAPGLQPLSSMVPTVVLSRNRSVELVIGAAGGTKITTQVALVCCTYLLFYLYYIVLVFLNCREIVFVHFFNVDFINYQNNN